MTSPIFRNPSIERNLNIKKYLRLINSPLQYVINDYGLSEEKLRKYYFPRAQEPELIKIEGIPMGVTEDGELICIPNEPSASSFGFFGQTGEGKSMAAHSFIDRSYYYNENRIVLMNDYQKETYAWGGPMSTSKFKKHLGYFLEYPEPLPIVLVIPNLKDKLIWKRKNPKIMIKIDFQEFVNNIEKFIDLGASEKYFKSIDFSKCDSWEKVENKLRSSFDLSKGGQKNSFNKIRAELWKFYDEGVIGFGEKSIIRLKITADNSIDNPIVQLLKCKVIPSLMTPKLIDKDYFAVYFKYFLDKIIDAQNTNPYFSDKRVLIYIEELSRIILKKNSADAIDSIKKMVMQGRMLNIISAYSTQNVSLVPTEILSNTKYRFMFRLESEKDLTRLRKDIKLNRNEIDIIKTLDTFEFYGTTSLYFIKYDLINNRKYGKKDKIRKIKAKLISPLSHHLPEAGTIKYKFDTGDAFSIFNYARQFLYRNNIILKDIHDNRILYKGADSKSNYKPKYKKPKLLEGIDLKKAFYNKSYKYKLMDYEMLKEQGVIIIEKEGLFSLKKEEEIDTSEIPHFKLPINIKAIYYHPLHKRYRLLGKKIREKEFILDAS